MACVVYQHTSLRKELNKFFHEYDQELKLILGDVKFVVSERKHSNAATMLFAKSSFSDVKPTIKDSQRCCGRRCGLCSSMTLPKKVKIADIHIKLDFSCCCTTESAMYLARCKNCIEVIDKSRNFYFGKTVTSVRNRMNGHREKFKLSNYDKSALSYHIYDKHVDKFPDKLLNYDIGIIKAVSPHDLDRLEDFYIYSTKAETMGLNRYKSAR